MRLQSLVLVAAVVAGCSSSSSTPTRVVTGQLTSGSVSVVARDASNKSFSSTMASGRFTLELPTGQSYELLAGSAHILWPTSSGAARWAKLGGGATLDLGRVSRHGTSGDMECDHQGSDDDHCDKDDHDDGDDDHGDHHGDHDDDDDGDGGHHHGDCDGGTAGGGGTGGTGGGGGGGGGPVN